MKSVILLKSGSTQRGGLEKWTDALATAFLQKGCRVTLLTTGQAQRVPPGIEVHSLKRHYALSVSRIRAFDSFCRLYLRQHPADLVFGLDRNTFQTHLRAGNGVHRAYLEQRQKAEGTLVYFRHLLNPLHRTLLSIEKQAFEHPQLKCFFANSEMIRQQVLDNYQIAADKIQVIHNGVEWEKFSPAFAAWPEKFKRKGFHFLFIGHGFRRKGLKRLLYGLHRLGKKEIFLSVVGKDKELEYFKGLAHSLKLQVAFYGEQRDVIPFYQQADALVIPSYYDPFANVTIEALALGLYVVSSRYNGGKEILCPYSGCTIEELDQDESVVQALEQALQHPKTLQSATQIRTSVQHLDLSKQLARFMELSLA